MTDALLSSRRVCEATAGAVVPVSFTCIDSSRRETRVSFVGDGKADRVGGVAVAHRIFPDDTIATVLKKLAAYAGNHLDPSSRTEPSDVYLWASRSCDPLASADAFVANVMRNRGAVHAKEARDALRALSGDPSLELKLRSDMASASDLRKAVAACRQWRRSCEPLTFRRFENAFPVYLPVDPFAPSAQPVPSWIKQFEQYDVSSYDGTTLETMLYGGLADWRLYATTREQVRRAGLQEGLFFQDVQGSPSLAPESPEQLRRTDRSLSDAFDAAVDPGVEQHCSLQRVTLSHNGRNLYLAPDAALDLLAIFNRLEPSKTVPYVGMTATSSSDAIHKVAQERFVSQRSSLPTKLLRQWCKLTAAGERNMSAPRKLTLVAVVSEDSWVFVRCDARLTWTLHFVCSEETTIDGTWPPVLERVVDWFREALPAHMDKPMLLPHVPKATLQGTEPEALVSLDYSVGFSIKRAATPSLSEFVDTVRCALRPVFFVAPNDPHTRPNTAVLTYTRHDNYLNADSVQKTLTENFQLKPDAAVALLLDTYHDLTPSEARGAYEDWQSRGAIELHRGSSNRLFLRPMHWRSTHVVVRAQGSSLGYVCFVKGVTRPQHVARINAALRYGLLNRAEGCRGFSRSSDADAYATEDADEVGPNAPAALASNGDIDDEFLAELQRDVADAGLEATAPQQADAPPSGPAKERGSVAKRGSPGSYILDQLNKADKRLFANREYGKVCSKTPDRQPIVISQDERERIDAKFPGSYAGFVHAGSSRDMAKRNIYICPYAWCPKSRTSLSAKQFAALHHKCPYPDIHEEPMVMNAPHYWKGSTEKFPGLMDPSHHPEGMAMPCCFKHPGRGKQWGFPDLNEAPEREEGSINKKYIRAAQQFPMRAGRMALLPPGVAAFFGGNKACGRGRDGTGKITKLTDCFVRFGVEDPDRQSFLASAALIQGFESSKALAAALARAVEDDMPLFLALNAGATCRWFADAGPLQASFAEFAEWLPRQQEYVARFDLGAMAKALRRHKQPEGPDMHRQYDLYAALRRFVLYLTADDAVKTPGHVLDLLDRCADSLASPARRILLMDVARDDSVSLACDCALRVPSSALVGVIVRKGQAFEPVVHVSTTHATSTAAAFRLAPRARAVLQLYQGRCWQPAVARQLEAALRRLAQVASCRQVLDDHHMLRGFAVQCAGAGADRFFLPIPPGEGLLLPLGESAVVSLRRALQLTKVAKSPRAVLEVLRAAQAASAGESAEFFEVERVAADGVWLKGGAVVPTAPQGPLSAMMQEARLDAVLAGWPAAVGPDARQVWLDGLARREAAYQAYKSAVEASIRKSPALQTKLYYLKHPLNPLSAGDRMRVAESLLAPVARDAVRDASLKERVLRHVVVGSDAAQGAVDLLVRDGVGAHKSVVFHHNQLDASVTDAQVLALLQGRARRSLSDADAVTASKVVADVTFDELRRELVTPRALAGALHLKEGRALPDLEARVWAFPAGDEARFALVAAVLAQTQPQLRHVERRVLEAILAQTSGAGIHATAGWKLLGDALGIAVLAVDAAKGVRSAQPAAPQQAVLLLDADPSSGRVRGVVFSDRQEDGLLFDARRLGDVTPPRP